METSRATVHDVGGACKTTQDHVQSAKLAHRRQGRPDEFVDSNQDMVPPEVTSWPRNDGVDERESSMCHCGEQCFMKRAGFVKDVSRNSSSSEAGVCCGTSKGGVGPDWTTRAACSVGNVSVSRGSVTRGGDGREDDDHVSESVVRMLRRPGARMH